MFLFDFAALLCYTKRSFTSLKDYNGSMLLSGSFREPVCGANRYGRKKAVSLLS